MNANLPPQAPEDHPAGPQTPARAHARRALAAGLVGLAVLLGACSTRPTLPGALRGEPVPTAPQVRVNALDRIVVDQEPIYVDSRAPRPIVFSLAGADVSFAGNGVDIEGEVIGTDPAGAMSGREGKPASFTTRLNKQQTVVQCKRESEQRVVCVLNGAQPGQVFLYTLRVQRKGVPLPPLDPVIRII